MPENPHDPLGIGRQFGRLDGGPLMPPDEIGDELLNRPPELTMRREAATDPVIPKRGDLVRVQIDDEITHLRVDDARDNKDGSYTLTFGADGSYTLTFGAAEEWRA